MRKLILTTLAALAIGSATQAGAADAHPARRQSVHGIGGMMPLIFMVLVALAWLGFLVYASTRPPEKMKPGTVCRHVDYDAPLDLTPDPSGIPLCFD